MSQALSQETMAIVKATAPALQQHGVAITTRMYERLFVDPEIKALFDMAAQGSGEHPKRLAAAILAFAQNVDKLRRIACERILSVGEAAGVVEPTIAHHVQPMGQTAFWVEFFR